MQRRRFIQLLGSGVVVYAANLNLDAIAQEGEKNLRGPYQAWKMSNDVYDDPRLRALSYAILAPNPHNRQPWEVRLIGDDSLEITCDLTRRLPATDPFDRQITIGFGCFLELLRLAGAEEGFELDIEEFPAGNAQPRLSSDPVARVRFRQGANSDPLFTQIRNRRSTKIAYEDRRLTHSDIANLTAVSPLVGFMQDPLQIDTLRQLTIQAFDLESRTPYTLKESIDLMRIGDPAIAQNPDGIDLGGPQFTQLHEAGILTHERLLDIDSPVFERNLSAQLDILRATQGYVWLVTPGNSRHDQLRAGRDYVRLNLAATAFGLLMHPTSQALQEFDEMKGFYQEVHKMLGVEQPQRIQMLARIGYGPQVDPSPRWPLETRLIV